MLHVLNAGEIELVDHMGSDASVVQAARISNGAVMPEWRGAPDERLIDFLAEHGHMTPFEHATFKFYVKAPIFVIREWQRHRTFSYNEMSARYKKLRPEFFIPEDIRGPDPDNKQGSIIIDNPEFRNQIQRNMEGLYTYVYDDYERMMEAGIAREIARSVLPVGIYSEMYVTGNFRNWMHFYGLRSSDEAQYEIRQYAYAIGNYLNNNMPLSFAALTKER